MVMIVGVDVGGEANCGGRFGCVGERVAVVVLRMCVCG